MHATTIRTAFLVVLLLFLILSMGILIGFGYRWDLIGAASLLFVQAALVVAWKRVEKENRRTKARIGKILNNLPVAISCADKNGNIVFNNKKYIEVIGYSTEDTPSIHSWLEKAYPDHQQNRKYKPNTWPAVLDEYKHRNKKRSGTTICLTCHDGKKKYFGLKYFKDGEYSYAVFDDITDYLRTEKALLDSRETLSVAVELAHVGPWKLDIEKNRFEFDDEFYAIYATDVAREGPFMAPEVYAQEFVHPDDARIVEAEVQKVLSSTGRYFSRSFEHRIIRRDGEVRTIVVKTNTIRDEDGNIVKWYGANQDITEYKQAQEALRKKNEEVQRMAYTDYLTGLPNRAHLIRESEVEMEKARRGSSSGVVLFIDLDNLKMVNDAFGHTYGDSLIISTGKRILEQAGSGAVVGRISGDEFVAVVPCKNDRQYIGSFVDEIVASVNRDIEILGARFHVSASAGVAVYPDDGDTVEEVFKNADNAMYAAKKAGKNCWRFYETTMQLQVYEKVLLTNSLYRAVERGELSLHYQPQVSVDTGAVVGFEALLRWNSPELGSISPVQFIPLVERSGLVHTVGEWVLREACRFARRLEGEGWGHIRVSVNVSPYQLSSDLFLDSVRNALNDFGVQPHRLELEITETSLITSLEEGSRRLGQLQDMGVRLSLDDFGTGYSSLTYLLHLPVNTLKIDKSFTEMIAEDGTHKAITGAVIKMAHTMAITVVAEGVETREQFDHLVLNYCDCVQGHLFSPPAPEDEALLFCPGFGCPEARARFSCFQSLGSRS